MASLSLLSTLALVLCLGLVQCQPEFEADRDFDRGFDPEFVPPRDQTAPECREKTMDIYFVLDSSTSIWVNDFERERQFVRDVVQRFDVGARATRVGILTFSDDIQRPPLGLNSYQIKSEVLSSVNEQNLPYRTGITNTDQAIRYVRENTEFRQDITKVIVVVTDGGSRSPGATANEAQLARENGFYLFVVGVGQYLDEREWRAIASDPDDQFIHNITNFRYLSQVNDILPPQACRLPPIILGYCDVEQPADLYLASSAIEALQLVDNFVERTDDDNNYLRVGVFMDACTNAENVALRDIELYCDREFDPASSNPTPLRELLNQVRAAARNSRDRDLNRKQVAVLFVDEETMRLNRFDFSTEARSLERDGVELIVADLGVRSYASSLQNLPVDRSNYVRFLGGSFVGQQNIQRRLLERTCAAVNRFEIVPPGPA